MSGRTRPGRSAVVAIAALAAVASVAQTAAEQARFPLPPAHWHDTIHDQRIIAFVLADRLEYRWEDDPRDARLWDVQGWVGGDWNKFWFKTEGEDRVGGDIEAAEIQALYARLISPFWHLQAGLRHDFEPEPSRNFAVLGLHGLGLYWFEIEASAFLSDDGDLSARFEAEYDLALTQRLVLQPRFETEFAAGAVEERQIGQGFNDVELELRLRYEIRREFAPYVGISWRRALRDTADLLEADGGDREAFAVIAGVRLWY